MNEEKLKRLKIKETYASKMFIDSEAVALSVIPFLDAIDLKKYLAINSRMHHTYDNDEIWRKAAKHFFKTDRFWYRYTKRDIKKCVHFKELTYRHTLPQLMDEVTNSHQLSLFVSFVNGCDYTKNTKAVMRVMISVLCPQFLRRTIPFSRYVYFPSVTEWPDQLEKHLRDMNRATMEQLGSHMIDDRYAPWEQIGTII